MLTVITINYNGAEKTIKLLESLKNQTDADFNILVLDNASRKEDFDKLESLVMGTITLIRSEENLGFGGGVNLLAKKAIQNGADWIVILNNDITLNPSFIALLRPNLRPENDIIGIPLDEDGRVAYAGKIRWLMHTLGHAYQLTSLPAYQLDYYAIGGAFAMRKEVFEKLGGFDPDYFMYFEDADLSLKSLKNGFNIKFLESPIAHHPEVSYSGKKLGSPLLLHYHYRNALYFNLKNGPWYIKLAVWPWSWIIAIKQLIKIAASVHVEESRAILDGVGDWYKGKYGKIV